MRALNSIEKDAVERCAAAPMLDQVTAWAAVNSGSRNLAGLDAVAGLLADAFGGLPGVLSLEEAAPVEAMSADGSLSELAHGRNLRRTLADTWCAKFTERATFTTSQASQASSTLAEPISMR